MKRALDAVVRSTFLAATRRYSGDQDTNSGDMASVKQNFKSKAATERVRISQRDILVDEFCPTMSMDACG